MVMSLWPRFLAHLVYAIYVSNTESLKNELTLQRRHIWQIRRKVTRRLYIHPKKSVASVRQRIAGCCRRVTLVTCTKKNLSTWTFLFIHATTSETSVIGPQTEVSTKMYAGLVGALTLITTTLTGQMGRQTERHQTVALRCGRGQCS